MTGDSDFYATVLALFYDDQTWAKMMDPFPEQYDGIKFYRLYLGNVVAYLKVDKQKARTSMREIQIAPNRPLFLIKRKFWGSKESVVMRKIAKNIDA